MEEKTKYDQLIHRLKNNQFVIRLLVFVAVIGGIGTFLKDTKIIKEAFFPPTEQAPVSSIKDSLTTIDLMGQLIDTDGKAIEGVQISSIGGVPIQKRSDSNGRFLIRDLPNATEIELAFQKEKYIASHQIILIPKTDEKLKHLEAITLKKSKVLKKSPSPPPISDDSKTTINNGSDNIIVQDVETGGDLNIEVGKKN